MKQQRSSFHYSCFFFFFSVYHYSSRFRYFSGKQYARHYRSATSRSLKAFAFAFEDNSKVVRNARTARYQTQKQRSLLQRRLCEQKALEKNGRCHLSSNSDYLSPMTAMKKFVNYVVVVTTSLRQSLLYYIYLLLLLIIVP